MIVGSRILYPDIAARMESVELAATAAGIQRRAVAICQKSMTFPKSIASREICGDAGPVAGNVRLTGTSQRQLARS
jgi:hypothetical protein